MAVEEIRDAYHPLGPDSPRELERKLNSNYRQLCAAAGVPFVELKMTVSSSDGQIDSPALLELKLNLMNSRVAAVTGAEVPEPVVLTRATASSVTLLGGNSAPTTARGALPSRALQTLARVLRRLDAAVGGTPAPAPVPVYSPLTITAPDSMPNGTVGGGAPFTPVIQGGTPPYTLSVVSGALAPGRAVSGTSITGTYTTAGDYSYVLRVTDSAGATATTAISVSVTSGDGLLDDPVMYQIGASIESQGMRGSVSPVSYGYTAQSPLQWANHLAPKRLFTILTGKNSSEPYYARPSSYATGSSGYTTAGPTGFSVNQQVDLAVAHAQTLPNGRQRVAWYSGGRNDITASATYINRELANLDKLVAVFDLVIVPGLWKRHTAAADGWQSGGTARANCDAINANFPARLAERYGSKVIHVPTMDIMCEPTGDQNPKLEYLCDGETHYSNLGAQAVGRAVYEAIKGRFKGRVDTGNLVTVSGNTGTLSGGVTGSAPAGFTVTKDPTVTVVAGTPAAGQVSLALTTAVTQATVAEGSTVTGPTTALPAAGNYRARMHVRVEPTPARVCIGGGLVENTGGATPQRAVGLYTNRANGFAAINVTTTATASIDTLDASNGLDLYIDTPDLPVNAGATAAPYVMIAADQGAVRTINCTISEWSVVRGADTVPTVGYRYAGLSKPEGGPGQNTLYEYEVIRSTASGSLTVPYTFDAGNTSADDYTGGVLPTGGSVVFAEGETSKFIIISVAGDGLEESAETFHVTLTVPGGYVGNGSLVGTGIVVNDDGLLTMAFRDTFTETAVVSITAHTANTGHTYARVSGNDMTVSPNNNRVRWNGGTGYIRSSYAPASANYDLRVMMRCVRLRASGVALRMGADGACVSVGYSANGAGWSCNDRNASNTLTNYSGGTQVTIELLRWYEMVIKVRGNTFEQYVDGVQVSATNTFRTNYGGNIGFTNVASYSTSVTEGWEYGEITVTEY